MTSAAAKQPAPRKLPILQLAIVAVLTLVAFYAALVLYMLSQAVIAVLILALAAGFAVIYGFNRFYNGRFIFPGIATVTLFVLFPLGYTIFIGFTNYSSFNLLTQARSVEVLMSGGSVDPATEQPFSVAPDGDLYRIWLPNVGLLSDPIALSSDEETANLAVADNPTTLLETRDAIKLRSGLQTLTLFTPDGVELRNAGLRTFASVVPDYRIIDNDHLERVADGTILTADHNKGFFVTEAGEEVPPGFVVTIGWDNFRRVLFSDGIRQPMFSIFIWTVVFATASVVLTFGLGLLLAVILQWPHLRFKPLYRILLILPYAVPGFISILVFRGLFNQNFGEINLILEYVLGVRPNWFTNANLARTMLLIVNTWLGYPYMMLLAMGFLQGVPRDHLKAAALEGAGPIRSFFAITLPQILPPFTPLLISSFAFNFNNMVLILLLTRGLPDIPGTIVPAGSTDILASFTYRIAFGFSSTEFGLAGAISLLIFVMVAVISYANFVAIRRAENRRSGK